MILDHPCVPGYTLQDSDAICGTKQQGSVGEVNLGGPGWPTVDASPYESEKACSNKCNERTECTHYIWFNDNGCVLQSSCFKTVDGYRHPRSFICRKGNKFSNKILL